MNTLNTLATEVRNAFGFPQFVASTQEPPKQPNEAQHNYKIICADGGVTDYFDELGVAI